MLESASSRPFTALRRARQKLWTTAAVITLYHCNDARSFRCLWLLEEMSLPYELKLMKFPPRLNSPDYLQVNPSGAVPFLRDGDAGLFESAAILEYLVTRYPSADLAVPVDDPAYGQWLSWLHFGEATLTTALSTLLRYAHLEPVERRQPAVVNDYRELYFGRLTLVEAALREHDYLVADRFTAADISVGYALMLGRNLGLHKQLPTAVHAYWKRLSDRAGFKAARAAQSAAAVPADTPAA